MILFRDAIRNQAATLQNQQRPNPVARIEEVPYNPPNHGVQVRCYAFQLANVDVDVLHCSQHPLKVANPTFPILPSPLPSPNPGRVVSQTRKLVPVPPSKQPRTVGIRDTHLPVNAGNPTPNPPMPPRRRLQALLRLTANLDTSICTLRAGATRHNPPETLMRQEVIRLARNLALRLTNSFPNELSSRANRFITLKLVIIPELSTSNIGNRTRRKASMYNT